MTLFNQSFDQISDTYDAEAFLARILHSKKCQGLLDSNMYKMFNFGVKIDSSEFENEFVKRVISINANQNFPAYVKVALLISINAYNIVNSQYDFLRNDALRAEVGKVMERAKLQAEKMYKETLGNLSRYIAAELDNN